MEGTHRISLKQHKKLYHTRLSNDTIGKTRSNLFNNLIDHYNKAALALKSLCLCLGVKFYKVLKIIAFADIGIFEKANSLFQKDKSENAEITDEIWVFVPYAQFMHSAFKKHFQCRPSSMPRFSNQIRRENLRIKRLHIFALQIFN